MGIESLFLYLNLAESKIAGATIHGRLEPITRPHMSIVWRRPGTPPGTARNETHRQPCAGGRQTDTRFSSIFGPVVNGQGSSEARAAVQAYAQT
jgi:hypothetical protein